MFKFVNYFKKNALIISAVAIISVACGGAIIVALNDTYAMATHTITFNRYEDTEIMDRCETDVNGKLDDDCISQISKVCAKWSPQSQKDGPQTEQILSSDFSDLVFTGDTEYYCVAGSSLTYNTGCYECKADKSIVHWAASGNSNDACPGGYKKIHENIDECKVYACYECSDDKNIMKWHYSGLSDDACSSGYDKTNKTQEECKPIVPDSCYVCKNDKNVMKWDNNGNADSNCSSGYVPDSRGQNECKTIIPNACYICKDNDNVLVWKNNGNSDNYCAVGYNKTDIPEVECSSLDNPPTGDITIFLVWILGLGCLVYSVYYFKNSMIKD